MCTSTSSEQQGPNCFLISYLKIREPRKHATGTRRPWHFSTDGRVEGSGDLWAGFSAAGNTWGSCIHSQNSTGQALPVELLDGAAQIRCILKLNKTKPPGMTRHTVADHLGERNLVAVLFKPLAKFDFTASMGNISDEQSQHNVLLLIALWA
jgi:hypothetical protein